MFEKLLQSSDKSNKAYNHVLKYTGMFGGVQGITALLSVVRNKFVAVLLGSVGLALIDIYNHAMVLLGNATQFGISTTAVRTLSYLYEKGDKEELREYVKVIRSWSLLTGILGFLVCVCFAPLVSKFSFGNNQYTIQFILLAPMVAMLSVSGVEMAILKALRRLKELAYATMIGAVFTLLICVPSYLAWGLKGIIPALVLSSLAVLVVNFSFSLRLYKWRANPFSRKTLAKGMDMIKLGISFIFAGVVASAAEMFVRSFLVDHGSLIDEGLYCSGFTLTVSYARIVFVSMEVDFFPRLSAICNDVKQMNATISRQQEVCVLLMSPFLIFFALFLPYIIHLLFAASFLQVVSMALCATFYMFFKSITTPIGYTSLAKGDSIVYFTMETVYYVVFVGLIMLFYTKMGLIGCGIALSLSSLFDLVMISVVYHFRYHFSFSSRTIFISVIQGALLAVSICMATENNLWMKYGVGLPVMFLSMFGSAYFLYKETSLVEEVKMKFHHILKSKQSK